MNIKCINYFILITLNKIILAIILFVLANILVWFQMNGQFLWKWFEKNPILLSVILGTIISYLFIYATKYMFSYFDGMLWSIKFFNFALGSIVYGLMTYYFMDEGLTPKTLICLFLALIIISVQVFMK